MASFSPAAIPSGAPEARSLIGLIDRVRSKVVLASEGQGKCSRSILAKPAFYAGILIAGVWNVCAEGSPIEGLLGASTLFINVAVGICLVWALLEPPYLDRASPTGDRD
jgi:hypothetical protein